MPETKWLLNAESSHLDHAEKTSATSTLKHHRISPEHGGFQVNHCKSPACSNYGVPPEQTSVRGENRYTLDSRNRGISSCICTSCGEGFPLKSNLGIAEEVERMAAYLSPPDAVFCRNDACANHTDQVPVGTAGAYASFGKTTTGSPRWRCSVCGKTFSQNTKATARQRDHHKNKTIFKLLVNKMPVRRIIEVADISPKTFYHRLDFLHRQCQAFAAHRERALANLPIRRLYLGVDRQDYLVNWMVRKDKRNIQLSAIAAVDNEHGYCFSLLERPIHSKSNNGRIWNGYSPYNPGNVAKVLDIMRTVHNYILTAGDGKTPAVRLGLAQAPLDYEDIIYFSSTD